MAKSYWNIAKNRLAREYATEYRVYLADAKEELGMRPYGSMEHTEYKKLHAQATHNAKYRLIKRHRTRFNYLKKVAISEEG
jgi:hypothetical protein